MFDGKRAATARVAPANADGEKTSLWRLDKTDFQEVVRRASLQVKQQVTDDPKYALYFEQRALKSALMSCPIFRGFDDQDVERCAISMQTMSYEDGQVIIKQGDKGNEMYFVKSGKVVCEKSGTIVAEIEEGGYFGELALLFNKPRAVTVKASGDVELWSLPADSFFDAVQDYSLSEKTLELLKEKYDEASLWNTLRKASIEEIFDLIRNASRPKKKNVTTHSVIGTLYAGMFVLT
jgi:CRP-like cAMP-binding protein